MDASHVATVILAGGKGTRLYPLTLHHCKPAISFGGRYRLIDIPISNSLHANYTHIYILAQYLSSELQHHISQTYRLGLFQSGFIDVLTPEENERGEKVWFEGTADAVRKTLNTLLKSDASYFLILSGDQLYHIDFNEMAAFAKETDAAIVIAAKPVPHTQSERFGVLQTDGSGRVEEFVEKPKKDSVQPFHLANPFYHRIGKTPPKEPHILASMGIYFLKREVLQALLESDLGEDFGRHLLAKALKKWKTSAYVYDGYWEDIGTIQSYYEANLLLTSNGNGVELYDEEKPIYTKQTFLPGPLIYEAQIRNSILCDGCRIDAALIEHSIIGMRAQVMKGASLRNSLLLENCSIGKGSRIERAILDENVRIGNNVSLINAGKRQNFDGDGVFIRDGIIIVAAGAAVQDNFTL